MASGAHEPRPAAVSVADLSALSTLDRTSLKQLWGQLWGLPAPRQASRSLLIYALAYRIQQSASGSLWAASGKRLQKLASRAHQPAPLLPGTRLIRQWRGQRHEVRVLESGYRYRGTRYASLSAIACLISGTHCSGPRFFGLAPWSTLPRRPTAGR